MVDISSAKITKLIIHRIGNKLRDEGLTLSDQETARTPTLDDLLLKSYLAPTIRQGEVYEFYHESNLSLNTIHHFSNLIFSDSNSFLVHSQAIAKHLYSASSHPNIGDGEFIVMLFDDIRTEDGPRQGLGLFRIEGKSDYLDVKNDNGTLQVIERVGISLEKIQKGAIVLSGLSKIFVIDALGQKTKYWLDTFLKVLPCGTPKACAKATGAFLKAISNKVESPCDALEFGKRIQESVSVSDSLSIGTIKNISSSYLDEDEVNGILTGIRTKIGFDFADDLTVESRQLTRYAKDIVRKTKITDGISLLISNQEAHIALMEIKKTKTGILATIDIQITEV